MMNERPAMRKKQIDLSAMQRSGARDYSDTV